jgi:hypothetical protein
MALELALSTQTGLLILIFSRVGWVNSYILNPTNRRSKCWVAKSATQLTRFA